MGIFIDDASTGIRTLPPRPPPSPVHLQCKAIDLPLTCTKLLAVDRLGSGVRVTVSFQICALTAIVLGGEGNCPRGGTIRGEYVRGVVCKLMRRITLACVRKQPVPQSATMPII